MIIRPEDETVEGSILMIRKLPSRAQLKTTPQSHLIQRPRIHLPGTQVFGISKLVSGPKVCQLQY